MKDPVSGRLKDPSTGNNAFHLLLGNDYSTDFISTVLHLLLDRCPEGIRVGNKEGCYPLHMCFYRTELSADIILKVIQAYPLAASKADGYGLIPLFLCVMREDSNVDICKALCKVYPDGPKTMNLSHSYPLHFAAKKKRPNIDIIRILLKRFPAAANHINGKVNADHWLYVNSQYIYIADDLELLDRDGH